MGNQEIFFNFQESKTMSQSFISCQQYLYCEENRDNYYSRSVSVIQTLCSRILSVSAISYIATFGESKRMAGLLQSWKCKEEEEYGGHFAHKCW
jgi:hypothetical protein